MYYLLIWAFEKVQISTEVPADYFLAAIVAYLLSVLWAYYWNNRVTIKNKNGFKRSSGRTLFKAYVSYSITGLILNGAILFVAVEYFVIKKEVAYLISLSVVVPLNYFLNKYWVYKNENKETEESS